MKKWGKRFGVLLLVLLAMVGLGRLIGGSSGSFGKALGVLEISGTIWVSDDWVKQIDDFRKNPSIRGVVVRINSPGGTVAASQEIFSALKKLGALKPVVASMGTIATSGGLYVALGANKIFADPGTLTGSIGVKMQHLDLQELLQFAKIKYETIKSGQFKDIGSFTKPLLLEERVLLEGLMTEIHQQFKEAVAVARGLKMEVVDTIADGRIFSGARAKELGLIDEIGDFGDAVGFAGKMSKIEGEPKLVYGDQHGPWWVKTLFGEVKASLMGPLACYLYP